ncbi:MAG: hypothetical protein ACREIT_08095 [Tepidisphaeraceae bacterium]
MSEIAPVAPQAAASSNDGPVPVRIESPPPAERPVDESPVEAARARLHELACALVHSRNRRLLVEYLRLRRSLR